jgi:FKBP-type peptidyl-prolyl cis-trans isomerase FklB
MTSKLNLSSGVFAASLLLLAVGCSKPADPAPAEPAQPTEPAETETMSDESNTSSYETIEQRVSYGVGHNMAASILRQGGLDVDLDSFVAGFQRGLTGEGPEIPEAELQAAFAEIQQRAQAEVAEKAAANAALALSYLTTNGTKPNVTTTESGLQYEVITAGDGAKPTAEDSVEVHYHGTLVDGSVFDSSVDRGETASFPVTGVIQGWVEALQLMSVGDKWRLTVPPALGYGDRGQGSIPAGSVLIFEVELIAIK